MPTQNGQAPGKVSMSGGWTWRSAPSRRTRSGLGVHQDADQGERASSGTSRPARSPCARTSPRTRSTRPIPLRVLHRAGEVTHYRPARPSTRKSRAIQVAMEAVTTGQQSPGGGRGSATTRRSEDRRRREHHELEPWPRADRRHARGPGRGRGPAPAGRRPAVRRSLVPQPPAAARVAAAAVFLAGPIALLLLRIASPTLPLTGPRPGSTSSASTTSPSLRRPRLPQRGRADPRLPRRLRGPRPEHAGPGARRADARRGKPVRTLSSAGPSW